MAYSFQPCKYTKKKLIVVIEFSFLNENKLFFAMSDILRIFAKPNRKHIILVTSCFAKGKMAERSNAAVLKTVDLRGSGGSNPSLSAEKTLQNSIPNCFAAFFVVLLSQFMSQKRTTRSPKTLQHGITMHIF